MTSSSADEFTYGERSMVSKARKGKIKNKKLKSGTSEKSRSADIEVKCKWPSAMLDGMFDEDEISLPCLNSSVGNFVYSKNQKLSQEKEKLEKSYEKKLSKTNRS